MIVPRFLKPKWRRANPEVRKQAVNSLTDQAVLSEVVRADPDPAVRRLACKRLCDLEVLAVAADADGDAGVREFAAARHRSLACGTAADSPSLKIRLAQLSDESPARLVEQAAVRGKEPELRLKAVQFVDDMDILGEIAARDDSARVRSAAAERLKDKDALELVLRKARKRDKKVYRVVRTKLKEITEQELAPARIRARCEALCERLEKLGRRQTWGQDKAVLEHLDEQWQGLESEAGEPLEARYGKARRRFLDAYEAHGAGNRLRMQEQEKHEDLRRRRQALLDEMDAVLAGNSERALQEVLERVPGQWTDLETRSEPDAAEAFTARLEKVRSSLEKFGQRQARETRIAELADEIEALLGSGDTLRAPVLEAMGREAGEMLRDCDPGGAAQRLREDLGRLAEAMQKQQRQASERRDRLAGLVKELQEAQENGVLKKATSLYKSLEEDIGLIEASGFPQEQIRPAKEVLRTVLPRLRELQNWRKWGTDRNRESLCRSMEELVDAELEPEQLAHRMQELQTEWKGLDRTGSPGNRALWDRFHGAADRVYARCSPYFAEQAQQKEANRMHREALCAELEAFLEKIDWKTVDWKKAVRAEREMRAAWSSLGPVEQKARKGLDKRFRKSLKTLDKHLADERARNQAHKQHLIAEARLLRDEPDLDKAIQELKDLQRQWHTTVAGKRGYENRIWQEFRAACDQVFARRQKQEEARREVWEENRQTRQGLCEELETLVQVASPGAGGLQQDFEALESRWNAAMALDVPQSAARGLLRRWQEGVRRYRECVREFKRHQDREQLELLHRRAVLCEELEGYLEHPEDAGSALQDLQARWQSLPPLDDPALQENIDRRYSAVHSALVEQGDRLQAQLEGMTENRERRETLCLRMEVLAGMESPPEEAQQRLALQVERLSEHLRQGDGDVRGGAMGLEQEWYLTGPAGEEARISLEQRFLRALQAMGGGPADASASGASVQPEGGDSPPGGRSQNKQHGPHHASALNP